MDQKPLHTPDRAVITDALLRTRLFADLPASVIENLARVSRLKSYADGECIIRHGDPGNGLVVIVSGCIVTSRTKANGKRLIFDLGQPGQVMGTFAVFDDQPSPLDNHARGDTHVVIVPYDKFRDAVRGCPDLAVALIAMHTRRNRMDFERMMTVLDTMRVRVAKLLLYLSRGPEPAGGQIDLPVKISQDDVAGILGVTRPSVNKVLVAMTRDGIVAWHYGHVTVQDINRLVAIASEDERLPGDFKRVVFSRSRRHYRTTD